VVELFEELFIDVLIQMTLYFTGGTEVHKKVTDAQYQDAETKGYRSKYPV
jgi:hypothetical protein